MYCTRKITKDIYYIGASDRRLALFENIFPIPKGVSYNAYLLLDEKTVLMDLMDESVSKQGFENMESVLDGRSLDYIVINHMEPDHCSKLDALIEKYPDIKVIGNAKTLAMIGQFYDMDVTDRFICVKDGDEICFGKHTVTFVFAPMVHWPEVMVSYDKTDKVLFSADAFGTFGALSGNIFNDECDFDGEFLEEARRYYTNIVGKYGMQVQALLKKASSLDISVICPLHGPVWRSNISYFIDKYNQWSLYEPEIDSVMIAYASMYGNTESAAYYLANTLAEKGVKNIKMYDVSRTDASYIVSDAFKYSKLVFASPTYNGGIYPKMETLLLDLKAHNLKNRTAAIIENGSWALSAGKQMRAILEEMKGITLLEKQVSIKSAADTEKCKELEDIAQLLI